MEARKRRAVVVAAGLALSLALVASGCGGTSNAAVSGDGQASSGNRDDAALAFARCMREHGVDMADPKPGDKGLKLTVRPGGEQRAERAQKACENKLPGGFKEPSAEERQRAQDQALKFARCMRAHGVDVPDPSAGKGGFIRIRGRQSPRFEEAQKACMKLLPGPQGGAR